MLLVIDSCANTARETAAIVLERLHAARCTLHWEEPREDPRIREREFSGTFQRAGVSRDDEHAYSRFFWRPPTGESCADVYDRVSLFMDTLWREFHSSKKLDGGVVLIVSHGVTVRLFIMRWLRWHIEDWGRTRNPDNCAVLILRRQPPDARGRDFYRLTAESLEVLGLSRAESVIAASNPGTWQKDEA